MLTIQPPQLSFNSDGIPCSVQFGDPYFSLANPLEESQHVFLNSTNISQRWYKSNFTIAELGFGFGINFITTLDAWRKSSTAEQHLHYISIEKYPLQTTDLSKCYKHLNIPNQLTEKLLAHYPLHVQGFHRIEFSQFNMTLTLVFGEALDCLKQCEFTADAWYLDGFAPNKNKALWSADIAKEVTKLTRAGGTLSTYSAASEVRKSFSNAGFEMTKQDGYGKKREMLVGVLKNKPSPQRFPLSDKSWLIGQSHKANKKHALVIGAGMAGCAMSAALAKRGWHVSLVDKNSTLANEASGNTNAILMPRISVDHDAQSQLTLLGFLYSLRYLEHLKNRSDTFNWHQCGAIQIPRDDAQWERMLLITGQEKIPTELLQAVSQQQASELANCKVAREGWYLPMAGWLTPAQLCSALIGQHPESVDFQADTNIHCIEKNNSQWHAYDQNNQLIGSANVLVIANALSANQFEQTHWCQLHAKRGQITLIPEQDCNIQPSKIVCADAYITPPVNNHYILGATFITADTSTEIRHTEHEENLQKLKKMVPSYYSSDSHALSGRAAIRAVSSDRLPIVGPIADESSFNTAYKDAALGSTHHSYPAPKYHEGLYIASGFGSRGLAWIPLCSEALACMINHEPSPLSKNLLNAIHPNRILMKNLVKHVQSRP